MRMPAAALVLVMPLVGGLGACARPAPITYRALALAPAAPAAALRPAEVAHEVTLVRAALERGYGGLGFVPPTSWRAMIDKLERAPQARDADQLCERLAEALAELPDAHLAVQLGHGPGARRCGSRPAFHKPTVGRRYGAQAKTPWTMDFVTTGGATFAALAIGHMPAHDDPSWKGYDEALRYVGDSHGILVDLRGNHGGDDARGRQLARLLLDGPPQSTSVRVHTRATPEAATLRLNTVLRELDDGLRGLGPLRDQLVAARDRALAPDAPAWIVDPQPPQAPPGPKAYPGPIAILVDAECASSCEGTLQHLRAHPRAKVFGERTAGYVEFGELGLLALPRSGIELWIPTKHWELPEGVHYEQVGIPPDVAVPAGQDAFDTAMAWLRAEVPASKVLAAADFVVPERQRTREAERLRALGLRVPAAGVVLERPFAAPLTRRSYVVPQGWLWRGLPAVVFAPALRADLPVLRVAMERAYGGWRIAEQHGWRWVSWFDDWAARLDAAGERWLPVDVAFDPIRKLEQHQLDNHTNIPLGLRFGAGSRVVVLAEEPLGACTALEERDGERRTLAADDAAQQPRRARRWDGASLTDVYYLATPGTHAAPVAIHCDRRIALAPVELLGDRAFVDQVHRLSAQGFDRPWLRHLSETVAYLRLPTFSKDNGELLRRDRRKWERRTGRETALIVDLRGNDGGDAAFEALEGWVADSDLEALLPDERQHAASCLYPALRWGYTAISSGGLQAPLSAELLKELQGGLDDLGKRDDPACRPRSVESHARHHYGAPRDAPRAGKPRIVVLVDGGCGSDCELMAEVLGKLPEAMVIGQNTFGVAQFIQPGYSVLPNTRLPFRIALGTADAYGDGRSFDGYGLDVDVLLDGGSAATDDGLTRLVEVLFR